jgi:hypothetical protein
MDKTASPARVSAPQRDVLPLQLVVGVMLAFKLSFDLTVHPVGDEAYYWLWGQKPDFSYFDHPPLNAWLQGLVAAVFGWHVLTLRLLTWVSLLGTMAIFRVWAKRLGGAQWNPMFWAMSAIYICSPVIFAMSTLAFNDHLMIFLSIAAAHFMLDFASQSTGHQPPQYRSLYAAGVMLGLAGLAKYDAIFMAIGFAMLILLQPRLRAILRTRHPYLAALACVAVQAPVFYWNFANGFASYRYNLDNRLDTTGVFRTWSWSNSADFLGTAVLAFSPFLIVAAVRAMRAPKRELFANNLLQLALMVFAASTLFMLALSHVTYVLFYWNIVGYLLLYPALANSAGRWTLVGHSAFGILIAATITFNYAVVPIANLTGGSDWESEVLYGWDETAEAARAIIREHPGTIVGATRYTLASQLGFALGTADVVSLSKRADQFKFWFDPQASRGREAIILADASNPIDYVRTQFANVTSVRILPVYRFGILLNTFTIYDCKDYRPT